MLKMKNTRKDMNIFFFSVMKTKKVLKNGILLYNIFIYFRSRINMKKKMWKDI